MPNKHPHPAFDQIDHRPWPLPDKRWSWRQSWCDLLFAHWPIPVRELRPLVPMELYIEEFDGTSWLGVVPFRMKGVMRRPLPDMPWISSFPEINLRLYVRYENKPGVWFLSLDAANSLAVWVARRFYHLPYYHAQMRMNSNPQYAVYQSKRLSKPRGVRFVARYRPVSTVYRAIPGTLEHWLTERYCLYARSARGSLYRTEVHHRQWPLQRAEAEITTNELLRPHGLVADPSPTLLHFSQRIDVVVWSPEVLVR